MAAGPIAGSVAVEVVADLTKLDAGLRQGEAAARSSAQTIASDLGKVEAAATGVAQAGTQAAEGLNRVRTASTVTTTLAANMDRATKAANDHAKAVGLSAYGWQNLASQANDGATMLLSGSSAFQVLTTQGGQVLQILQGANGGVAGAMKSIGQGALTAARAVGVAGGAFGVIAGATVAAVAAGVDYGNSQRELERSLSGVGRASGVTASQITAIARESASAGGVSTRVARDMAGTFASTGRIGSEMLGKLISSTKDYAATTGQDMAEAQAELAKAFADPSKGADELNSRLGFLNDTTRETIQRLQNQGDRLGAQKALFDAYAASLTKASELTSGWGRITAAVGATVGTFWDNLGQRVDRVLTGGPIEQQLADARQWLQNAQAQSNSPLGRLFSSRNQSEIAQAQAEVDRVQGIIDTRSRQTEQAQIAQNSLRIGGIVRSVMPDLEQLQQLEDEIKALREATAQPLRFGLDGNRLNEAVQATETLARRFEAMSRDIERFGSVAVAQLNRAADLANRTVGFAPSAKSAAQIEQDYQDRIKVADSRELAGLRRARDTQLDTLRQETYRQSGRYGTSIRDVPEQYRGQVYDAAISQGLDPDLLASVFRRESRFRPDVISGRTLSPAGAIGPFQFMPETARGMNVNPLDFTSSANGAARFLRERLNARNGDEALALADYNWGLGNVNRVGRDVSRFPRETRGYINEVLRRGPDTAEQVQDQEARTRALENERRQLKLTAEAGGRDAEGLRARVEASQAIANAQGRNIDVSKDLAAQYAREAMERSRIVTGERVLQFNLGAQFDREQLGRTAGEQAAYARARAAIGDTDSPAAQAAIQQQTLNDNLRQTKSLANDAFSGMLTDLRQGVSLSASLGNVTGRLADRLLSMASDRVISSLFSGLTGAGANAGGGIMAGIASIFGGGALPKFAVGGITSGPSLAGEAGPEAVIPLSGRASIPVELKGANANAQAPIFQTVVNNNHPSAQVETREVPDGRGGRKQEIVINEAVARGIRSPQGQAALGAPGLARR